MATCDNVSLQEGQAVDARMRLVWGQSSRKHLCSSKIDSPNPSLIACVACSIDFKLEPFKCAATLACMPMEK